MKIWCHHASLFEDIGNLHAAKLMKIVGMFPSRVGVENKDVKAKLDRMEKK